MTENKFLSEVQKASFTLTELNLYLDTHPHCEEALAEFNKARQKYNAAVRAYEENVGPLTRDGVCTSSGWTWINDPWPWEIN